MSPAEALQALHRAGRIRSPWLPGMRATFERKWQSGRIPFRRSDDGLRWLFPSDVELENSIIDRDGLPDLSDPATVGCLLALLREASGDPRARPEPYLALSQGWHIAGRGPLIDLVIDAPTEGEAIIAALIALAGAP